MHPSSPSLLLSDLLTSPTAVLSERLVPLARELSAARHPTFAEIRAGLDLADDETLPWEEPLYRMESGGIAVVSLRGTMVKCYDAITCWFFGLCSIDRMQSTINELAARDDVRAIVLHCDSGGGMVLGTPELGDAISAAAARKPLVSFTDGMMCSGAYWAGCSGSHTFATRSAMVGSIGVYLAYYDYSAALAAAGIRVDLIKAGDFKGMFTVGTALSAEQRTWLTAMIRRDYEAFTAHVRAQRGNDVADETMQGQWFNGSEAVARGLVDSTVAGLGDVLTVVQEMIGPALSSSSSPAAPAPVAPVRALRPRAAATAAPAAGESATPPQPSELHLHIALPQISLAAPQVTVAPADVNVHVDARLEKDSIRVEQHAGGGKKVITKDPVSGAITGIESA